MTDKILSIKDSSGNEQLTSYISFAEPRRGAYRKHNHVSFEISAILDGYGRYEAGKTYDIATGDVFIFSTNEQHCITDIYGDGMRIINVKFDPSYIFGSFSSADFMRIFLDRNASFENRLDPESPFTKCISDRIKAINKELREQRPEYENLVKFMLVDVLITIYREYGYCDDYERGISVNQENFSRINEAVLYVNNRLTEDLTLGEIAAIASFSPNYFCSLFKAYYGMRIWDYISIKRVDAAKRKLGEEPDKNVLTIANECGFNNTANFNKIFKKVTGTTPKAFRTKKP